MPRLKKHVVGGNVKLEAEGNNIKDQNIIVCQRQVLKKFG